MYEEFKLGADLVVASRFIKGGSMKVALLKSILVDKDLFSFLSFYHSCEMLVMVLGFLLKI